MFWSDDTRAGAVQIPLEGGKSPSGQAGKRLCVELGRQKLESAQVLGGIPSIEAGQK